MKVDPKTVDFVLDMISTVFAAIRDVVHRYYFEDKKEDRAEDGQKE